jgi:hypothetical protein
MAGWTGNMRGVLHRQFGIPEGEQRPSKELNVAPAKNFIAGAIKKPGALHAQLGVPQGEKIPEAKLSAAAKKGGKLGQRARFAQTLKGLRKGRGGRAK